MTGFRSVRFLIGLMLVLAFTSPTYAAERKFWRHSDGHFENIKDGQWEEKSPNGNHHFVEKERTEAFIELFDKTRACFVRLYENHCDVKFQNGNYQKLYDGTWRIEPGDITGIWDSDWGYVTLQTAPIQGKKALSVTGSYVHAKDQTGLINSGTFYPGTGVLEFAFEEPWRGKQVKGTATLTLSVNGKRFKGPTTTVNEKNGNDKGVLSMTRLRGHNFATRVDSIVADAGINATTPGVAVLSPLEHGKIVLGRATV